MSALLTLHSDQRALSRQQIGASCKGACAAYGAPPFLNDTTIAAANTNAGLQTAVNVAAAGMHASDRYFAPRINLGITLGLYSTELSDSRINALTTEELLVGLTWAPNDVITGIGYPPE
jgi:hypothetical protein